MVFTLVYPETLTGWLIYVALNWLHRSLNRYQFLMKTPWQLLLLPNPEFPIDIQYQLSITPSINNLMIDVAHTDNPPGICLK